MKENKCAIKIIGFPRGLAQRLEECAIESLSSSPNARCTAISIEVIEGEVSEPRIIVDSGPKMCLWQGSILQLLYEIILSGNTEFAKRPPQFSISCEFPNLLSPTEQKEDEKVGKK